MTIPASFAVQRKVVNAEGNTSVPQKPQLTAKDLRYAPVFLLYKGYLVSKADAQDDNLEKLAGLCLRFNMIPSIDLVNWIIKEANIVDERHRLNFPVYAFMQEFKFKMCISPTTQQPRLFVGKLRLSRRTIIDVWAGWPGTKQSPEPATAAKTKLHSAAYVQDGASKLEINPEAREQIVWEFPFEMLFAMNQLLKSKSLKSAVQVQNAILLSVVKVVLRFPGLREVTSSSMDRLAGSAASSHPESSKRPFDSFDDPTKPASPDNPYQEPLKTVNVGLNHTHGVHRCHPPDQQDVPGNKATKRKREDSSDDSDSGSEQGLDDILNWT